MKITLRKSELEERFKVSLAWVGGDERQWLIGTEQPVKKYCFVKTGGNIFGAIVNDYRTVFHSTGQYSLKGVLLDLEEMKKAACPRESSRLLKKSEDSLA